MGSLGLNNGDSGGGTQGPGPALGNVFRNENQAKRYIKALRDSRSVIATEGAWMPLLQGRRIRVAGTIIYCSDHNVYETSNDFEGENDLTEEGVTVHQTVWQTRVTMVIAFGIGLSGINDAGKIRDFITINAGGIKVWTITSAASSKYYTRLNIHKGGIDGSVDSDFENEKGSGRVPAHRYCAYIVIKALKLEKFGNSIPTDWEAVIQVDDLSYLVSDAISDIWKKDPNRSLGEIDVSNARGDNTSVTGDASTIVADGQFEGAIWEGPTTAREAIETIKMGYDLWHRERAGKAYFYDRGDEEIYPVTDLLDESGAIIGCADVGASEDKSGSERPIQFHRSTPLNKVPTEVDVGFYSQKMEFQRDSTRKRLVNDADTNGVNVVEIDLPLVLSQKASRRIACRRIVEAHKENIEAVINLSPSYVDVECQDILAVVNSDDDQRYYIRADEVTIGNNFMVTVTGQVVEIRNSNAALLTSIPALFSGTDSPGDTIDAADDSEPGIGDGDSPDDGDDYFKQAMITQIISAPPVSAFSASALTFVFTHAFLNHSANFDGSTVYRSLTGTGAWTELTAQEYKREYPVGFALAAAPAQADAAWGAYLDTESEIDICMHHLGDELESITDEEFVVTTRNRFLIGDEVVQARDIATLAAVSASETMSVSASAHIITRASGTWAGDGFAVGQLVRLRGFVNNAKEPIGNDRVEFIVALGSGGTANQMVISVLQGDTLVDETLTAGVIATAVETNTSYRLSHLIRGLRDTADHTSGHAVSDVALRYEPTAMHQITLGDNKYRTHRFYRSVCSESTAGDALTTMFHAYVSGESQRPFRPVHLHYLRGDQYGLGGTDPENVVKLRWLHQTRLPDEDPTGPFLHAKLYGREKYTVEIYFDSGLSSLASARVYKYLLHDDNRVCEFSYTNALQTTDGFTPGDEFWVRIRQIGAVVIEGNWSETLHVQSEATYRPPTGGLALATSEVGTL